MFNALKYIKNLEEVGFRRDQAEAQVQIFMEVIDGVLVTKTDLDNLKREISHEFALSESRLVIKLGLIAVSCTTIAVAVITWLIKI